MNSNVGRIAKKLARRKRRIEKRLQAARDGRFVRMMSGAPAVLSSAGLKYELAEKTQAIVYGGVPLMLRVARESGLIDAIDSGVRSATSSTSPTIEKRPRPRSSSVAMTAATKRT